MDVPLWAWFAVVGFVLVMLALDLLVFHRDAHEVAFREAVGWSAFWVALGLAFGGIIWWQYGGTHAGEYYAGYLIEKSLAVDNIFVFAVIFSYFAVPAALQHRVLFWGVLGALVFRAAFIGGGSALVERFDATLYVFGAFLLYTAWKMWRHTGEEVHPEHNPALQLLRRAVRITREYEGQRFFAREGGKFAATPLLAVLVVVETSDILFAVDSIPAIFAVTREPFLVFTSNVFAILGLRAMYFMLARAINRFVYLKPALAIVLAFVGLKLVLVDVVHLPTWVALTVVAVTLGIALVLSLRAEGAALVEAELDPLHAEGPPPDLAPGHELPEERPAHPWALDEAATAPGDEAGEPRV